MNAYSFHQKCNSVPNAVNILKATKGYKFGGYIEQSVGKQWFVDER